MIRPAILAAAACAVSACNATQTVVPPPPLPPGTMAVEPPSLVLSDTKTTEKFFVSSSPTGSQVTWQIAQKPDWLTVTPDHGTASLPVTVTVTAVGADTLPAGSIGGSVRLISDGGGGGLTVVLSISPNLRAVTSVASLAIGDTDASKSFYLKNGGNTYFAWTIAPGASWLRVVPASGTLQRRDSVLITALPDRRPLPGGTSTTSLTITLNEGISGGTPLPVSVSVPAVAVPATSVARLAFVSPSSSAPFTVYNRGKGTLTWGASAPVPWLSFQPASGSIPVGDSTTVTATVSWSQVPASYVETLGQISTNGQPTAVPVQFVASSLSALAPGALYRLAPTIVDAEYDAAGDRVIAVGTSPNTLVLIDATIPQQQAINLPAAPTSVSVRADGRFAAVGHDGAVSLVDLTTRSVVRTVATAADVLDLVLAGNNWAYIFPRRDQWVAMRNVNLNTGADLASTAYPPLYAGTVGRLHPNGHSIYLADNGLSPSDFLKYDVSDTLAVRLYDSRYHGDYAFSGNLWFSQDGGQLFARSGNVFKATSDPATDITYVGRLQGVGVIDGAVHSALRNRIYALNQPDQFTPQVPELRVHSGSFFGYLGSVPVPTVTTPGGTYPNWGRFIFLSADHHRLVLLVEADQAAGLSQRWSLVYLDTTTLP